MGDRHYQINALYRNTLQALAEETERWKGFLDCAGYNFKLRFDEQVLLYAQRPDATAVLTIAQWNRGFHRWVNRGAKGIAVFDEAPDTVQKIRYYFDISDTHEGKDARSSRYEMEDELLRVYPQKERKLKEQIFGYQKDMERIASLLLSEEKFTEMTLEGRIYTEKKQAGAALLVACQRMKSANPAEIGSYKGFAMFLSFDTFERQYRLELRAEMNYAVILGDDGLGNLTRIEHAINKIPEKLEKAKQALQEVQTQMENAKEELKKTFPREEELEEKSRRLQELDSLLNLDQPEIPQITEECVEVEEEVRTKEMTKDTR